MILRRPYGFLIKHFRLLHLILFFMFAYITSRANNILNFFKDYISVNNNMEVVSENYINVSMFIFMFFIIVFLVGIYYLMRYKKKPRLLYLFGMVVVVISSILFVYLYGNIKDLETSTMAAREIRLLRDISRINYWLLFVMCLPMLIRGLGFDIKKFNFTSDLKELNLTSEDSAEVEVNVDISNNTIQRIGNKSKRELKYYYLENKFFINIIFGVIFAILFVIITNKIVSNRVLNEGEALKTEYFNMMVEDSYISENKKNISDEYNYLILKVSIKGRVNKYSLNLDQFVLYGKNNEYIPTFKYYNYFTDIGYGYLKDTKLNTNEYEEYIFIYNIKDEDKDSKLILKYLGNNKKVRIKPKKID